MKLPAPAVIIAVPLAVLAAGIVSVPTWAGLRTALLPALAVIAAAVFVRLARGMPFTNADHFSLADFKATADRLQAIAHKLRTMMVVCLAAIVQLVVYPDLLTYIDTLPVLDSVVLWIGRIMSALVAATTVYAFVRVLEVIEVDVAILKLQARVLEKAIAKKNAKAFDDELEAAPPGRIAGAGLFGRLLQ